MMWHARSAWWLEIKAYARRKPHAMASTPATPKKNVSCFFGLAGVNFFLKMERTFFFGVLPSKYSGSAWGFNTDSAKRKSIFLGDGIPIRQIFSAPIQIHIWNYNALLSKSAIVDNMLIS